MPWEVALACSVQPDKSHDHTPESHDPTTESHDCKGLNDRGLFVAYLHRLLNKRDSELDQEIVKEVLQSDPAFLLLAMRAVLEEGAWRHAYDHTHSDESVTR